MIKRNNRKGFTIVELVIVIAVIVVLAAVLIPTFASIIKKANESVDMQVVKQMNTILQADELANSKKPATVVDAQNILIANGADDFTPADSQNVFYWVGSENRVILWTWEDAEEPTAGEVVFPKELAKKYKDTTTPSVDWHDLATEYEVKEITAAEGQTLEGALLDALNNAHPTDPNYFSLPANSTVTFTASQIGQFNSAITTGAGLGKNVSIDLNNSTINAERQDTIFKVADTGSLEFINGTMNITSTNYNHAGFQIQNGASLTLRDVDVTGLAHTMIFPSSKASEVILDGCNIECDAHFGLMTNGMTSDNIRIVIKDTTFKNVVDGGGIGVMVNCGSNVHIENSHLAGSRHALVMRAGHAEVSDTTLEAIATFADIYKYNSFKHFPKTPAEGVSIYAWSEGNAVPGAVLVLGDYSDKVTSYPDDVDCDLSNVTFKSANTTEVPNLLIAARKEKDVVLNYNENCNFGDITLYEMVSGWFGSITVNGEAKTLS